MKFSTSILYTIATALFSASTVTAGCDYIGGNYYCNSVSAIQYQNLGFQGSYNDVTNMDETSCECSSEVFSFSGTMAPLDEELSVHFRGPIKLAQFGVYYPASSVQKRENNEDDGDCTTTKHVHHKHKRAAAVEYKYVTETVYQNADGNAVTSSVEQTTVGGPGGATTLETQMVATPAASNDDFDAVTTSSSLSSSTSNAASSTSSSASSESSASVQGDWTRSSYFTPGSADNCVFMNNMGGTSGSGTWSSCFGNSISFAASDGVSGASSAQALGDVTLSSNKEFMIFSGSSCDASGGDCGYYRDGIPAYHGFGGQNKIFVFEFQMPKATDDATFNYDMPAIWLLNAKIPRTLQYGNSACSCWSTGCGEFDVWEILSSGSDKLISHLHDGQGTGSSDYIPRPYDSTMKGAVIFKDGDVTIVTLEDSVTFDGSLSNDDIENWISGTKTTVQVS